MPGKLRAILAKVAADGYAVVEEEYVLGGSATAAPVFGGDGTVVAALNVGTVSARYPAGQVADHRRRRARGSHHQPASRLPARGIGFITEGIQR